MKAIDVLKDEMDNCRRKRLTGEPDPQLFRALRLVLLRVYGENSEMSLEDLLKKLHDPLFISKTRQLGPKGAKVLIDRLTNLRASGL